MNNDLKKAIETGELILFLGAGASKGCKDNKDEAVLDGWQLAENLAAQAGYAFSDDPLDEVYAAARAKLGSRLDSHLETLFRDLKPSKEYLELTSFAWRRIYSLNIDDALEAAIRRNGVQYVRIRLASDAIEEQDSFFKKIDLVKLNGSVDRLQAGVIFSASDYAKATSKSLPWYEQCGSDFVRSPVLFIGTKLNEPLLKFHIERYKSISGKIPGRSFVITPSATEFQKASLAEYNIQHISGTLGAFVDWLKSEFVQPLSPMDLALKSLPHLAELLRVQDSTRYISLFDHVIPVKRNTISKYINKDSRSTSAISNFYKGFKPSWQDIVDEIPATLDIFAESLRRLNSGHTNNCLLPIIGPAGSGKTTLLMQLCYVTSTTTNWDVYFIEQPISKLSETLEAIENSSSADLVLIALDNLDFFADDLKEIFASKRLQKTMLIGTERESIWKKKTVKALRESSQTPIHVDKFSDADALRLLEKLEKHGSWTRLGQLPIKKRVAELVDRAQKQLLIALIEATFGLGYGQIIANEFSTLTTEDEKLCFLVVGLITDRKQEAPVGLVDRALSTVGIIQSSEIFSTSLAGIVIERSHKLSVRHPVYVRYVLDHLIDPLMTIKALSALLDAFAQYESPVIKHVDKVQAIIYKGLINHAFLREVLKGRKELVTSLYKSLEKKFEQDGLFWLQYGLSMRDFGEHIESLEKLRIATQAYSMPHTLHALAQQLLIVAQRHGDKRTALTYADEAKDILENLDGTLESDDTFPVVTLTEGYTNVLRIHESEQVAREQARKFAERLKWRKDLLSEDQRLQMAYEKMFRYSATGTWIDIEVI
jgi:energy-coupling factor transporter ATP-binding protein EcfA2